MNVILVHGFLGSASDWDEVRPQLASTATRPSTHGLEIPPVGSWDEAVAWLVAVLPSLPPPRVLIGYSMGGRLALAAALAAPHLLRALILESTSPGIADPAERQARAALDAQRAAELKVSGTQPFVHSWYDTPFWSTLRDSAGFEALRDRRGRAAATTAASHVEHLSPGRMPDLWPRLPDLAVPTLWICGRDDPKYLASTRAAADAAPQGTIRVLDAGHNTHHEAPGAFIAAVSGFIARA